MTEWGRNPDQGWTGRKWVWTRWAGVLMLLAFLGGFCLQYRYEWTTLQQYYLFTYVKTWAWPPKPAKEYPAIYVGNKRGWKFALDSEIELGEKQPDGTRKSTLLSAARSAGLTMWTEGSADVNDRVATGSALHVFLRHYIYRDWTTWDFFKYPMYGALGIAGVWLCLAWRKDRERHERNKRGRRLRGPELVGTAEFNKKLTIRKWLTKYPPDGLEFTNEERSLVAKLLGRKSSVRIPREREAMHLLVVGDSGHGKSATIRQTLMQIEERGEAAIVYDPAMEYLPQFYDPRRGDVVLNPLDARCPFWTPGDEVPHPAEALSLAASLFPDEGKEKDFFLKWSREIFAHLINLKPTPGQLIYWLSHEEEIDRLVQGTEMAAAIHRQSANQRNGVLGSLNTVAGSLKLLPSEGETRGRWSAAEWSKKRKGWIFITSKPTMRERLRPLISLWLDLLVLRLMNESASDARKVWFVLDEVASLQRLPQLTETITQSRKSNCPVVLGFQGKAQIEALYGHIAEAMLSQPMTKIFLKTSEPNAAKWISEAIGEIEVERYRESRTHGRQSRDSSSQQLEITREPLVMASEISGLDPLQGYLKHGNYVVQLRVPYPNLEQRHEKFIERKIEAPVPAEAGPAKKAPEAAPDPELQPLGQQRFFE